MDPAFRRVANRVPVVGEGTAGQVAAFDGGIPGIANAGQVGLLTAAGFPGGAMPPTAPGGVVGPGESFATDATLGTLDPLDLLDPVEEIEPVAPPARVGFPLGPAAARGTAGTLAPVGRTPCGTGWPGGPSGGTGWPDGAPLSARAGERGRERRTSRRERSCALAGQLGSVPVARDFARATVCGWGLPELCDDVTSVVSELVTNALRYGLLDPGQDDASLDEPGPDDRAGGWAANAGRQPGPIELRLMLRPADMVCMVADPGTGTPSLTEPGCYAEGGRGLHVVQCCSDRWGWDPLAGGGKVVWAAFHL